MTIVTPPALSDSTARPASGAGAQLVAACGRTLPLRRTRLRGDAAGGLSRVVLEQTFVNTYQEPLRVSYQVPLPADAAVSGYEFELAGVRTVGRVAPREDARRMFENALLEGRAAALLEEQASTRFDQEIGNVPAGESITISLTVDMRLSWLASTGEWEWRFPTVIAPRFEHAEHASGRAQAPVAEGELPARVAFELGIDEPLAGSPSSPSHSIAFRAEKARGDVGLGSDSGARLDRDLVVRWPVAGHAPGVLLHVERPPRKHAAHGSAFGLVTIVPPSLGSGPPVPRDLVVLLDTSGSMSGEPLAQAVAVTSALVESLGDHDRLELIEFSVAPHRWKRNPVFATAKNRASALRWLGKLRAAGGTEMRDGILAALEPLGPESQRQVVIVSDGLIGFEDQIVAEIRDRLPSASRVHALGVGHGVNRSLTRAAARAGRGVERILTPGESPAAVCSDLLRASAAPIIVDVHVEGSALRALASPVRDLFAGAPSISALELEPAGGTLRLVGRTADGPWEYELDVPPLPDPVGDGLRVSLFARERVEDLEVLGAAGRDRDSLDAEIERLGVDFQIATRRTSWVAVSRDAVADPTEATRVTVIPHELAAGLSVEGLGLRSSAPLPSGGAAFEARLKLSSTGSAGRRKPVKKQKFGRAGDLAEDDSLSFIAGPPASAPEPDMAHERFDAESMELPEATLLSGVVASFEGGRLVIEVTPTDTADWLLLGSAELRLRDGTRVTLSVDQARSTASGVYPAGTTLRLVVDGAPEPAATELLSVHVMPTDRPGLRIDIA